MFVRRLLAALCMLAVLFVAFGTPAQAEDRPILTAGSAMQMIHGCIGKASQEGWLMHIAVMDNSARLKAYYRMDDAQMLSQDVALAKARTSAMIAQPTGGLAGAAFPGGSPSAFAFVPGLNFFEGGLPIVTSDGYHLGGIGVSGSSGANDAICAQAGLDAAADAIP